MTALGEFMEGEEVPVASYRIHNWTHEIQDTSASFTLSYKFLKLGMTDYVKVILKRNGKYCHDNLINPKRLDSLEIQLSEEMRNFYPKNDIRHWAGVRQQQ